MQAHAIAGVLPEIESLAKILNGELQAFADAGKGQHIFFGLTVFEGVAHRFLGDTVEVRGHHRILHHQRGRAREFTLNPSQEPGAVSQFKQRVDQTIALQRERRKPVRQGSGSPDNLAKLKAHFAGRNGEFGRLRFQFRHQSRAIELEGNQLLAEAVVEVAANAIELTVADFQNFPLEAAVFGDVGADGDVLDRFAGGAEEGENVVSTQ